MAGILVVDDDESGVREFVAEALRPVGRSTSGAEPRSFRRRQSDAPKLNDGPWNRSVVPELTLVVLSLLELSCVKSS